MKATLILAVLLALSTPAWAEEVQIGTENIINQGSTRTVRGQAISPVTIRNWFFDLNLDADDWPHGPQFLDVASISSINRLGGSTTPRSYYILELEVFRTPAATSLPGVGGANAIRGVEVTMTDQHMPWETPHDAARWRGLGIYAPMPPDGRARRLGTAIETGGTAGWAVQYQAINTRHQVKFMIDGEGEMYLETGGVLRQVQVGGDGVLRVNLQAPVERNAHGDLMAR